MAPGDKVRYGIGYRISSVNGNQFFNDARLVNGSLASTYQSPYANVAYKLRHDLTLKAEYNFYGYGEGGPSGSEILQLLHIAHVVGCSLHFSHRPDRSDGFDDIACRRNRAEELPCQ